MKIYDTDREVYARTTKIKPLVSKSDIDAVLARFGIKESWWHWDLEKNLVWLRFRLPPERFGEKEASLPVEIIPPRIWTKKGKGEVINWRASIRNMYWYILTHLSQAYVSQSPKSTEFLPHIITTGRDGKKRKVAELLKEEVLALPAIEILDPEA